MLRHHGYKHLTCTECGYTIHIEVLTDEDENDGTAYFLRGTAWIEEQKAHDVGSHGAHQDRNGAVTGGPQWESSST